MSDDGVHFNDLGNLRLYKSIKASISVSRRFNPYSAVHPSGEVGGCERMVQYIAA